MSTNGLSDEQRRAQLASRMAAARKARPLTQAQVADAFGLNKATVSAWESGRGIPDAIMLSKVAEMYGVSADALLWGTQLTTEAMQFAAEFQQLSEGQRKLWKALVSAAGAQSDELPNVTRPSDEDQRLYRESIEAPSVTEAHAKRKRA